jgi:endonuclease/exonuclease/phosphatase family metal-dependent hydrolase
LPLYANHKAAFQEADFLSATPPFTYKAFTSKRADRTIDHAFVSPAATVVSKRVHEPVSDYLSDHQPLEVVVRFD